MKRPIRVEGDVAYVPLTQGYEAVIDAADIALVTGWCWCAKANGVRSVYAVRSQKVDGRSTFFRMHRILLNAPANVEVDHIDGDGLNNRRNNLRLATHAENARNQRRRVDSTSGFKGVTWHKARKHWYARIRLSGQTTYLGSFGTAEEAHAAYRQASASAYGEFWRAS